MPGEGVVRLSDDEVVDTRRHRGRRRMHNIAKGTIKDLQTVNVDEFADKRGYYASLSYYGAIGMATKQKAVERIESKINTNRPDRLPDGISLQALQDQG